LAADCASDGDQSLELVFGSRGRYRRWYSVVARKLCQSILVKYFRSGTLSLPIPQYRGFHVRPSTLIAKIAMHYGTALRMKLLGHEYDATMPLELFRANEEVNAVKRRRLADKLGKLHLTEPEGPPSEWTERVRGALLTLAERQEVVIYEQPLPLARETAQPEESILEYCVDKVKKLLALGKIDLDVPIEAEFTGDVRVLQDLKLLAGAGYGEDRQGHNIPLPKGLAYLRRTP
jgi:hypothetical protein